MYAALLNNQLILATTAAKWTKKANLQGHKFLCPHCQRKVQLIVRANGSYFKHERRVGTAINEQEEHALSKQLLHNALLEANFAARVEVALAAGQLRADVLASPQLAFEVQCAPLGKSEFSHRHLLYQQIGIKDIWIVGKRHYLRQHIKKTQLIFFCENKLWHDYYLEIAPYDQQLRLKYNVMLEPLTQKVHYQAASFALNASGLSKLWHFQPKLKNYQVNAVKQRQYLQVNLAQKTNKGMQIATMLYDQHLSINDLPAWVFSRMRHVNSANNASAYLKSTAGV